MSAPAAPPPSLPPQASAAALASADALFLCAARVSTFAQGRALTNATGFYFRRDERLYLVTSRHVLLDEASRHRPDRIEIELHVDAADLARSTGYSILLYAEGKPVWREGRDASGAIDVAVVEIERRQLPESVVLSAFTPAHLAAFDGVRAGAPLLILGFPLGFHDVLHHLPVVRQSVIASSYGLRFDGQGYFLTDGRVHRGSSGAPVVMHDPAAAGGACDGLPWRLLGVHSTRLDAGTRDLVLDESLGLNCAWYADILLTLTQDADAAPAAGAAVPEP